MKFKVSIPEVHYQDVIIDATDEKEALEFVRKGEGEPINNSLEYSHTSENENYHIEEY